jgi:hypothetical protein
MLSLLNINDPNLHLKFCGCLSVHVFLSVPWFHITGSTAIYNYNITYNVNYSFLLLSTHHGIFTLVLVNSQMQLYD